MVLAAYLFYFALVLAIGLFTARVSGRSMEDFFLGGRRMGPWVVALSAVASGRSAWLVLGLTGMAYARGLGAVWAVVGYILVELFLFMFLGRRLRRFTGERGAITLPDFLEARFPEAGPWVRLTAILIIVVFLTTYVGAQTLGGGKAFHGSLGIPVGWGVALTAGIVLFYTILGGFYAVSFSDVVQALFMILGLVVLPATVIFSAGGLNFLLESLRALSPTHLDPWALGFGGILGLLGIGLGSPGNPHILVRYMSARDEDTLRRSGLVGTVWNVVMAWGAIYLGMAGRALVSPDALPGGDPENLYALLAGQHFHPFVFGLVMAAVFAAIMSTVDSQLLIISSGITRDILQRFWPQRFGERVSVALSRLTVLLVILAGLALGYWGQGSLIFWFVLLAWAGLGAAFGPPVILGLYWRGANGWGALAGMLVGATTTFLWKFFGLSRIIYELVPGFAAGLLAVWLVSLVTKNATLRGR